MPNVDISECELYRSIEQITEPDSRGVGIFYTTDLATWQKHVDENLQYSEAVPEQIQIQLETAKNLFLYSWFVYRFGMVAKSQFLNITELALKERFEIEGIDAPRGLRCLLEKALKEKWFDDSCFSHLTAEPGSKELSATIIEGMGGIRNTLNHGSTMLMDPLNLISQAQICLDVINALFSDKKFRGQKCA